MTEQERREYKKIKQNVAKEILSPDFCPNRSMSAWMLDLGDYAAYVYMEPCDLGGVFVSVHLSFFWRVSEDFLDWYSENGRITSPEVPDCMEALLYKSEPSYDFGSPDDSSDISPTEEFGKNLRILLRIAREKALEANFRGDYTKMLQHLWKIRGYTLNVAFNHPGKRIDLAIVSILAGDFNLGRAILNEISVKPETPLAVYVRELLEKSENMQEFRQYIRQRVITGREIRRNKFPKLQVDALPDLP